MAHQRRCMATVYLKDKRFLVGKYVGVPSHLREPGAWGGIQFEKLQISGRGFHFDTQPNLFIIDQSRSLQASLLEGCFGINFETETRSQNTVRLCFVLILGHPLSSGLTLIYINIFGLTVLLQTLRSLRSSHFCIFFHTNMHFFGNHYLANNAHLPTARNPYA